MKNTILLICIVCTAGYNAMAQKGGLLRNNGFNPDCFIVGSLKLEIRLNGKIFDNEVVSQSDTIEFILKSAAKNVKYRFDKIKYTQVIINGHRYVPPQVQESDIKKRSKENTYPLKSRTYSTESRVKIPISALGTDKCIEQVRVQIYNIKQLTKDRSGKKVEEDVSESNFNYQCAIPFFYSKVDRECYK